MTTKKAHIVGIVGARPNFMKMAPIARLLRGHSRFRFTLVHTGQHYDSMSDPFMKELGLPKPRFLDKTGANR